MKTFVILLLLANIAYFGWSQAWFRDVPPPPSTAARVADDLPPFIPAPTRLTLLEELPPESKGSEILQNTPSEETKGSEILVDAAADESKISDPLVQESKISDPLLGGGPWCANLGLFTLEEEALALLPRLADLGVQAQVQSGLVPVASTFWVHLPPFASEAEAFRTLQELQERNIDSYYMRSGEMAGGISLGVFSRPESAEVARANLERRGYMPSVREVTREENRFWVALSAPSAAHLETPQWLDFRANFASLPLTENVCGDVALPPGFP